MKKKRSVSGGNQKGGRNEEDALLSFLWAVHVGTSGSGVPAFFLALESNNSRIEGHFLTNVFLKALPGGLTDVLAVGLIFCSIFHNRWFALSDMSTKCTMLFIVFSIATEPIFRYLSFTVEKIRAMYRKLRGRVSEPVYPKLPDKER